MHTVTDIPFHYFLAKHFGLKSLNGLVDSPRKCKKKFWPLPSEKKSILYAQRIIVRRSNRHWNRCGESKRTWRTFWLDDTSLDGETTFWPKCTSWKCSTISRVAQWVRWMNMDRRLKNVPSSVMGRRSHRRIIGRTFWKLEVSDSGVMVNLDRSNRSIFQNSKVERLSWSWTQWSIRQYSL